ncbi:MAG: GtrA family protein [Treponema sp.]|nr:GtrA family protein [Treponema sp.]
MKKDLFDLLMEKRCFRFLNPFYKRHKEVLLYLFFGGLSFLVNLGSFMLCASLFDMNELAANVIAWIITVLFVYVTNKLWVFKVELHTHGEFVLQIVSFFVARVGTLVLEEVIIFCFITKLKLNSVAVKVAAQIVVIVANYIMSKLVIFRKKGNEE